MFRVVAAAVVLAALLVGCSSTDRSAAPLPLEAVSYPVDPGSLGPGAPLPDWFTVPEGTVLIGGPVPVSPPPDLARSDPVPPEDRSWRAYLAVVGDPQAAMADLLAQAEQEGLVVRPVAAAGSDAVDSVCSTAGSTYHCDAIAAPFDPATANLADPVPADELRAATIELHRFPDSEATPGQSLLTVTVLDNGYTAWNGTPVFGTVDAPPGPPAPPLPARWVPLPEPGDRFEPTEPGLQLEPDSRLLAPLLPGCEDGGFTALLGVDGDPGEVLAAYRDQAGNLVADASTSTTRRSSRLGDETWVTVRDDNGSGYTLTLIENAADRPLAMIQGCVPTVGPPS